METNPRLAVRGGGPDGGKKPGPARGLSSPSQIISAVKRSIGFTIGFHNHGEGPY